jgi:hypothetical protein
MYTVGYWYSDRLLAPLIRRGSNILFLLRWCDVYRLPDHLRIGRCYHVQVNLRELCGEVGGGLVFDRLGFVERHPERDQAGLKIGLPNVLIRDPRDKPLLQPVENKGLPLAETLHLLNVQPVPVEKL